MNRCAIRWVLFALCLAFVAGAGYVLVAGYDPARYVGRTRAMEDIGLHPGPFDPAATVRLNDLAAMASGPTVVDRSCKTLSGIGIRVKPSELAAHLKAQPVPNTQIVQIEVRSMDPNEARSEADVVAHEFRNYHKELEVKEKHPTPIRIIDPAYSYRTNKPILYRLLIAAGILVVAAALFVGAMLMGRE